MDSKHFNFREIRFSLPLAILYPLCAVADYRVGPVDVEGHGCASCSTYCENDMFRKQIMTCADHWSCVTSGALSHGFESYPGRVHQKVSSVERSAAL